MTHVTLIFTVFRPGDRVGQTVSLSLKASSSLLEPLEQGGPDTLDGVTFGSLMQVALGRGKTTTQWYVPLPHIPKRTWWRRWLRR